MCLIDFIPFWQDNNESITEVDVTDLVSQVEKVDPSQFQLLRILGQGSFGQVIPLEYLIEISCFK